MRQSLPLLSVLAVLAGVALPSRAFEILVQVETANGEATIVGPYVYRQVEHHEPLGSGAGGTLAADFRDGTVAGTLRSSQASDAATRGVMADFMSIDVPDSAPGGTLDIPWQVSFDVATSLTPTQRDGLGSYRVRLLSAAGSVDHELALADVFALPPDGSGRRVLNGTLSLPASDVVLSVYQIYTARLEAALPATLDFSAALVFSLPDYVNADVRGCSLLPYQAQFDRDDDGVNDAIDNCKRLPNPAQIDQDGDGIGNWCDGDFNNNGEVTGSDLALLRARFFSSDPLTDMNSDGVVNAVDLGLLRAGFLRTPGPSCALPRNPDR